MHTGMRNMVFVIIGCVMGSGVTPEVVRGVATWPASVFLLAASVAAVLWTTARLLERGFRHGRTTAVLAAAPGHLSFVMSLGAETGGHLPAIGVIQSIRLLCLTLIVPFAVTAFGYALAPTAVPGARETTLPWLAALVLAAWAGGWLLTLLKMPASWLIGGLFVSTAGHATGVVEGSVPQWLSIPAYVFMGSLIGSRFAGVTLTELRRYAAAGLLATAVSAVIAIAFAVLAAELTGLPMGQVLIAFAPGGVETMSAMAVLMHADPAYVAAHHVLRLFVLTGLLPLFLFGGGKRKNG